ncbi:hypothetical protein Tco_1100209 [Tanacetum coccineum]
MKDKVVPNNSQVKDKKTEVEDHPRISSISNKTKSVTASNDSLKSRTSNVNAVCATCGKCVFNSNHDACVSKYLNDVNARTKKPKVVPISTRKPKSQANKSVATPLIIQLILFIVDSGCTKHMTGNLTQLCNFIEKYLGFITSKASIRISSQLVNFVMRIWRSGGLYLRSKGEGFWLESKLVTGLPSWQSTSLELCASFGLVFSYLEFQGAFVGEGVLEEILFDLCRPLDWNDSTRIAKLAIPYLGKVVLLLHCF